jgi:hypothetical protein
MCSHTHTHKCTPTHKCTQTNKNMQINAKKHTHLLYSSNSKYSRVSEFLCFHVRKYLSAVPIHNEYQETLVNQVNFFKHSLPMV